MALSLIPGIIQMERFMRVECVRKKGIIPFEAFPLILKTGVGLGTDEDRK